MTDPRVLRSPLMRSAFEVLEHGLWHFTRSDTTVDMKFAIMHVDQAIELVLKERVRVGGQSIFKQGGKETISIWKAYDILEEMEITVPERPDLEILHEERNGIQHRHSNPNPDDATFMVTSGVAFIHRFLDEELDVSLVENVPLDYLHQLDIDFGQDES